VTLRILLLGIGIGLAPAGLISADQNVREVQEVQEKLRDGGFYSGEIDGAYSSQLAEALTRYQTQNQLPVTGQLDVDTSNALGAKPAVANNRAVPEQSSETSQRWRNREQQTTNARERSSPGAEETESNTEMQPRSAPTATENAQPTSGPPPTGSEGTRPVSPPSATERTSSETTEPASAPAVRLATVSSSSADGDISTERLRDYVGEFVHAGLDPDVGSEADFFADRVKYYDQGVIDRQQVRNDLQDYAAHWPERHFWFAGNITIEPQHRKRVRVSFPLRYELRNGATYSSGTINKTLVLEPAGDDLQIVAVSERDVE
jgi:hypothetical protein